MSTVDQRVVEMKFDQGTFKSGVASTLTALADLKKGLELKGATKGLEQVDTAAKRFSLKGMTDGLQQAMGGFTTMGVVAATTIASITTKAVAAGAQMVKSLSMDPVLQGFKEYELKMGSIQTIMANTARHNTSLETVNAELNSLNKYADKTIYNFAEMTKNASLFTASGMKIEDATTVIKGFSNAAAASGTSAQGAAGAAYQLSQALNTGTIRLMDWKSLQNVGMGNKNMQDGLIQVAQAMGTFNSETTTAEAAGKNFNGSLEKMWLSADVMSSYLKIMSGDMTDAELAAIGLDKATAEALKKQANTALEAATKVRTLTQLMSTLKEAVASGWTESFEIIFGDFTEATELFTAVNDTIGGMLARSAEARNKMLKDWDKAGGRIALIDSIKNAWNALISVIKPIQEAFREIFPAKTGAELASMTKALRDFTEGLKIGGETADFLKRTFAGVFAVFSIAITIVKAIASAIGDLFSAFSSGDGGGLLSFTAGIGDFLVNLDQMLKKTGIVKTFFATIASVIAVPIKLISELAGAFGSLFSGGDSDGAKKTTKNLDGVTAAMERIQAVSDRVQKFLDKVGEKFRQVGGVIGDALGQIGPMISKVFSAGNFDRALELIQTGLLGGLLVILKKFSTGLNVNIGSGGFMDSLTGALDGVTGALKTMQADVKSNIILKIAIALGVLAAAMFVLSTIAPADLAKSIGALAAGMAILAAGMIGLSKSISLLGAAKLPFIAASMLAISGALLAIALAMKIMASMSFEEIHRGIVAIAGSLTAIAIAMRLMPKNILLQAAAIVALSGALVVLAGAMKLFATMQYDEIARGLVAIGGALVVIAAAMRLMPKGMVLQAAALAVLAGALNVLAVALKVMATMDLMEIGKSLGVLAGSLLIIGGALRLMPGGPTMVLQAAALTAISVALNIMALALKQFGGMTVEEIAKGLITLAGALLILAGGLTLMNGTLMGSAALTIAAAALALLVPTLISLGVLDWTTIVKGLTALAGVFVVLGVAGLVIGPLVPVILGLGAAMVLLGAGLALAGVGMLAMGTAFGIVVATGMAGVEILAEILSTFVTAIPEALAAFGRGIVALAVELGKGAADIAEAFRKLLTEILLVIIINAPLIAKAFTAIVASILDAVVKIAPKIGAAVTAILTAFLKVITDNAPKIASAIGAIMSAFLKVVVDNAPKLATAMLALIRAGLDVLIKAVPQMADAGFKIIMGVIDAAAKNIGKIVKVAADLIVNFLNAIGKELPRVIDAGVKLIISFINGVADAIRNNGAQMREAGRNLAGAIIEGMTGGLADGARALANKAADIAKGALDAAKSVLGINSPSKEFYKVGAWTGEGMADGLESFAGIVANTAEAVGTGAFRAIRESISGIPDLLNDSVDMTPVIRPVMDLSGVRVGAGQLDAMFDPKQISVDGTYSSARDASAGYRSNQAALAEVEAYANGSPSSVSFTQVLNSPKPINRAEVYRQTNNLISSAKEELTNAHNSRG